LRLKQCKLKIILISHPLIAVFEEVLTNMGDKDHPQCVYPKAKKYGSLGLKGRPR